jgi:hypothetical protein
MHGIAGLSRRGADDKDAEESSSRDARHRRELAELLLPALFASLAQLPPDRLSVPIELENADPMADGWRTGASPLTPTLPSAATDASAPGVGAGSSLGDRVTALVDAGELGAIRLTVERTAEGVAVRVAAADPATAARAELERASLEQALRAAGLHIASVTVVNDVGGILLAQPESDSSLNLSDTTGDSAPDGARPVPKRFSKRLNLTG